MKLIKGCFPVEGESLKTYLEYLVISGKKTERILIHNGNCNFEMEQAPNKVKRLIHRKKRVDLTL